MWSGACGNSFLIASLSPVKHEARSSADSEDGGKGLEVCGGKRGHETVMCKKGRVNKVGLAGLLDSTKNSFEVNIHETKVKFITMILCFSMSVLSSMNAGVKKVEGCI